MNSFKWLFKVDKRKKTVRIICLLFVCILIIWRTFLLNKNLGENVGPLDFVAKVMKGDTVLLIVLPIYIFFANSFTSIKNEFVLVRLQSRSFIYNNEILAFAGSALFFSIICVVTTYISSGLILSDFTNQWGGIFAKMVGENTGYVSSQSFLYTSPSVLLIYTLFTTIGFLGVGSIFILSKLLFKNTAIVFVLLIVIIMLDSYSIQGKIFSSYITLEQWDFLRPLSIVGKALVTVSIILISALIGNFLMNKHDFILTNKKGAK